MPRTTAPSASIELQGEESSNEEINEYMSLFELVNNYVDDSRRTILTNIFDTLYSVDITAPLSVICMTAGVIVCGTLLFS